MVLSLLRKHVSLIYWEAQNIIDLQAIGYSPRVKKATLRLLENRSGVSRVLTVNQLKSRVSHI